MAVGGTRVGVRVGSGAAVRVCVGVFRVGGSVGAMLDGVFRTGDKRLNPTEITATVAITPPVAKSMRAGTLGETR